MKLTEGARRLWEGYAADVRRSLAGRDDIDADDVVAGVREHVEAELGARGAGGTTAEELSDVLDRLGPPGDWVDAGDAASPSVPVGTRPGAADDLAARRWLSLAALVFTVVGAALVLGSPWWGPGWGALVLAAVLARVALEGSSGAGAERTISPAGPLRRLTEVVWWTAVLAAAVLLLLGPAAVTWGAAQTGGALEPVLSGGGTGVPRPDGYWRAAGLVMAGGTGLWWLVLSAVAGLGRTALCRALGPAAKLIGRRVPVALAVAGSALVILALIGGLL